MPCRTISECRVHFLVRFLALAAPWVHVVPVCRVCRGVEGGLAAQHASLAGVASSATRQQRGGGANAAPPGVDATPHHL